MYPDEENQSVQVPWVSKCIPFHLHPKNVELHVHRHEIQLWLMLTQYLGCRRTAIFRFWDTLRRDFCRYGLGSCLPYFLDPPSAVFLNRRYRICKAMQNDIGDTSPKQRQVNV